ncbi:MAG: type secretion system export apparatus subunit SctR [Pseudomonadota bacterium]|jgi:type III secretion protein R|uniref:Type III secretion system export apparatus subunit SctR n=2 Tax=Thiothrix fructosivorans TaxID=111770 RepID=A0A8B0SDX8_9GAMM|nr:type III secretion system export apparatus subunit SctR [Thiothrix fructosivorans]QTX09264.1 type III secretion system export apparatus subunit SctR [Thiothrix fructosivorans]
MESMPNPIILLAVLTILGLAPFIAIMVSSFVKLVIVMHIIRSALGLQQEPPNLAISGIAIILSIYIMAPVAMQTYEQFNTHGVSIEDIRNPLLMEALEGSTDPLKQFLSKHSSDSEREFFTQTTKKLWPEKYSQEITNDHLLVLIPSFMVSELTTAFQVGFLIFLPFVVIDLVISNLLMSMGMMMLSPMTISLPFKLLLFVLVDGWSRLIHGLILSY